MPSTTDILVIRRTTEKTASDFLSPGDRISRVGVTAHIARMRDLPKAPPQKCKRPPGCGQQRKWPTVSAIDYAAAAVFFVPTDPILLSEASDFVVSVRTPASVSPKLTTLKVAPCFDSTFDRTTNAGEALIFSSIQYLQST